MKNVVAVKRWLPILHYILEHWFVTVLNLNVNVLDSLQLLCTI